MEERQTNFTIMEGYELPSKGLIYSTRINPNVELRSMTAKEEMQILSNSRTPLKVLSDIIESCMIEKPAIHVYDMALGDYEFLLQRLRVVTFGNKYKVSVGCPTCGHFTNTEINLDKLEVNEFDENKWRDLVTITLPKTNQVVSLNFTTPRMMEENAAKAKEFARKYKGSDANFELLVTFTSAIDLIDGKKLSAYELENWINQLPALDLIKIRNSIDALNEYIGIDNTFFVTCDECKEEIKSFFRIGPEFFQPTNI